MSEIKLISKEKIAEQVERLALDILTHCKKSNINTLTVVWLAEGAIFFVVDLLRKLESIECEIVSIRASSYGMNTYSSGSVELRGDFKSLKGKDILLVDDILDSGLSLKTVIEELLKNEVKSCKSCVLLDKNKAQDIKADFKCFDIEDKFVYGYGLDIAELKRNSQDIFYKE
ncbi:MAG: phosphoribosyltransferase family protein [Opitutales bacterium]